MAAVRINARIPELFRTMRTAMLAPATNGDRALAAGAWRYRDEVALNEPVEQVTIVSRDTFAPGDLIEVYDSADQLIVRMNLLAIRLVNIVELSDDEMFALGFDERADALSDMRTLVMDGKAWWFDIERLDT